MNQVEKAISMDGCVYCWAGVTCHFPAVRGGIPPECKCCGWNPAVEPARKAQARERLRRKVKYKPPAVPIGEKYKAERNRLRREGGRNNDQS